MTISIRDLVAVVSPRRPIRNKITEEGQAEA
jgi:hypothetical protein